MSKILEGLDGVVCLMDDVLVFSKDQEEHNRRLKQVLEQVEAAKVTLKMCIQPVRSEVPGSLNRSTWHSSRSRQDRGNLPNGSSTLCL